MVCEVPAREIARWPGIADRSLFGLNVRGELPQNRVRTELDKAIRTPGDHYNFVAYHNGLTVVCDGIELTPDHVEIENLSVVNGAQSVLAFARNVDHLTDELHVLVKFVESTAPEFATEVARRSNTQTAVNPRNLRANDGRQQRLLREFERLDLGYNYVVKPEATRQPEGEIINNDDAAQLLCAFFNQRPWLAVKRQELFRQPNYGLIFNADITASHVLLAHLVRKKIQEQRGTFPQDYRKSWALTAVMAVFLVGQVMRSDPAGQRAIRDPAGVVASSDVDELLERCVRVVSRVLHDYHRERIEEFGFDDYRVDFKRENTAHALSRLVTQRNQVARA